MSTFDLIVFGGLVIAEGAWVIVAMAAVIYAAIELLLW